MMDGEDLVVSRSLLFMETRFTAAWRSPASPIHTFMRHLKSFVLWEMEWKSSYFVHPAAPQVLGPHSTWCIPHPFRSKSKDGTSLYTTITL